MAFIVFACGCVISRSMFGEGEVLGVSHCDDHRHLYSQDKDARAMADELTEFMLSETEGGTPNA